MKKRTVLRSAAALALTVVMVLALALPALAASGGGSSSITINPNGQEGLGDAGRFTAYQIFKGDVNKDNPDELDDLEWGNGVDPASLVSAMQQSGLPLSGGETFGTKFTNAYKEEYPKVKDEVSEAEFVAQWLAAQKGDIAADDFARIVAGCLQGNGNVSHLDGSNWVIDNLDSGYYLVKDNYESEQGNTTSDGSVSSYILQVIGNEDVDLKATIPTVTKKVEEQDGYLTGIDNQTVHFTLTGTVAENIAEYSTYKYEFVDTLSAGLTMDTPISDNNIEVKLGEHRFARGTDYTTKYEAQPDGSHVLTITFNDLIDACTDAGLTLNKDSTIVVSYVARLTKDAVVTSKGNPNTVTLKYSNDPYESGEGETAPDEVKTYTIALNIVKQGPDNNPLENVGFKLKNERGQYATLEDGTGGTYKSITGWDSDGTEITTGGDGKFSIHGLDAGKYSLVETSVPEGYEKMKDIVFDITATVDANGALTNVTLKRDPAHASRTDVALSGDMKEGTGTLTLTNFKSPILPHTGGIGAGIVYLVSALAVVTGAAIVYLATRKRGRGRHEQSR